MPLEPVGFAPSVIRPWELPPEAVGFAPGAAGRWQQRRIPQRNKSDTPSDLRFLRRHLWELPLELSERGNRPWMPWELPLERVGFTPGAADRGNRLFRPWKSPPESGLGRGIDLWSCRAVGYVSGARGICPWSHPAVGIAPGVRGNRPRSLASAVESTSGDAGTWESPLEPVGFAPGAAGRGQQRLIPQHNKSDTPSDLRFLKRHLWDLSLESSGRGICLWNPWDLPLEARQARGAVRPPPRLARPPPRPPARRTQARASVYPLVFLPPALAAALLP